MAELSELKQALRNAHAAGDTAAARKLASVILQRQGSEQPTYRGGFLPYRKFADGRIEWDFANEGATGALLNAFRLPGDVVAGRVDPKSDEAIGRATNLAALASPINPAVRAGDKFIPGVARALQRERTPTPTAKELGKAASEGYDAVTHSGVTYNARSVADVAELASSQLFNDGFGPTIVPRTQSILDKLRQPPEGSYADVRGVHAAIKNLRTLGRKSTEPAEREAARRAASELNRFITDADPSTVRSGDARQIGKILAEADGNYGASKRAQRISEALRKSERNAAAANSGHNGDNSARAIARALQKADERSHHFNAEETAALEAAQFGTRSQNIAREIGNRLGGGGGLGGTLLQSGAGAAGYAVGGWPGAAAAAAGTAVAGSTAKRIGAELSRRNLERISTMTRQRSPLYQQRIEAAHMIAAPQPVAALSARSTMLDADKKARLIQALMRGEN